jgi:hypothetical protein
VSLYERDLSIEVDAPVLILGLEGYIDAGLGGAAAVSTMLAQIPTAVIASFDNDALIDRRARRPVVRIVDGVIEGVQWPDVVLRHGVDVMGNHLLFLLGPEPDMQWRRFIAAMVELSTDLGVRMAVGLGAFPAPVPHTRAVPLSATATSAELAAQVGFLNRTIDVPGSLHTVLEGALGEAGIPSVGLWARVPHYAAAMPYPGASLALLEKLEAMTGVTIERTELVAATQATRERVDSLIANSDGHVALVRQLERQADIEARSPFGPGDLPSGDEIAAELERFLRGESS